MNAKLHAATIAILLSLSLAGCGVTIGANKIDITKSTAVHGEGIVYALPKTTLDVVQPIKLIIPKGGALAGVWDECQKACSSPGATTDQKKEACTPQMDASVKFGIPLLRTRTIPDASQLYRVQADAEIFQSLSMKFEIDQSGILKSADSSAQNLTYDIASTLVKDIIATAPKSILGVFSSQQKLFVIGKPTSRSCFAVSADVAERSKNKSWFDNSKQPDMCSLVSQIKGCMKPFEDSLNQANVNLTKLFESVSLEKTDAKVLEAIASFRRDKIAEAKTHLDEVKGVYGLAEEKPTEAAFVITIPVGAPDEMQAMNKSVQLLEKINANEAIVVATSEGDGKFMGVLLRALKEDQANSPRLYEVEVAMPTEIKSVDTTEAAVGANGYRYRVPLESLVKFAVNNKKGEALPGSMTETRTIAQHGPIAALTSRFKGKGGKVSIKLWPDSGGIQIVEIGADPIPTSAFSGSLDELSKQVKAKKDIDAEAAKVDQELEALKRDVAIKELEKKKKDLEKQLAE
ncbi:MAG: hypothetical protein Q7T21_01255 [Gallionella sp.]|nr:hypothetical protein [Gallionella sp.]